MKRTLRELEAVIEADVTDTLGALVTAEKDFVPRLQARVIALRWVLEQTERPKEPDEESASDISGY